MEVNHNDECDAEQKRLEDESSESQEGEGSQQGGRRRSRRKTPQQRERDAAAEHALKLEEFEADIAKQLNRASLHKMDTSYGYPRKWDTHTKWTLMNLIIHIGRLDRGKSIRYDMIQSMSREEKIEWIDCNWDEPNGICREVLPHEPTYKERWTAEYHILETHVTGTLAASQTTRTVDEWRSGVLMFESDVIPFDNWLNSYLPIWGRRATRGAGSTVYVQNAESRTTAKHL